MRNRDRSQVKRGLSSLQMSSSRKYCFSYNIIGNSELTSVTGQTAKRLSKTTKRGRRPSFLPGNFKPPLPLPFYSFLHFHSFYCRSGSAQNTASIPNFFQGLRCNKTTFLSDCISGTHSLWFSTSVKFNLNFLLIVL